MGARKSVLRYRPARVPFGAGMKAAAGKELRARARSPGLPGGGGLPGGEGGTAALHPFGRRIPRAAPGDSVGAGDPGTSAPLGRSSVRLRFRAAN